MQLTRGPRTSMRLRHLLPLLVVGAVGCGSGDNVPEGDRSAGEADRTTAAVEIVDAAGRTVRLDGPAARIISLVPSATQTLRTIGASDRLVGRTDYDTEAWIRSLPSVGGGLEPNLEAVVTLRPDLVVRFEGSQDRRTPARLDELGIPHLAVRPDGVGDVLETVRMLGLATGRVAEADSLRTAIRTDLADLETRVAPLPRKTVAYVLGGTPPWVAGPGTYIHELVTLAGGDNVFGDLDALYAPVSPEEVRSRPIDVVLASGIEAFDRSLAPDARVEIVDDGLEIPGPDLATSALRLAELIHGPLPPSSASSGP
jgi:iron complex transport system substrate-binding protein